MNLDRIPHTAAAIRAALEATGGDESMAALSVWNVAKGDDVFCSTFTEELLAGESEAALHDIREQIFRQTGASAISEEMVMEMLDPRENPALAAQFQSAAGARLVRKFKEAVDAVAADWRQRRG